MTWNPKRWTHRHQAVLIHVLEFPAHRAGQIGAATGYSADHVLHLMRTPEFRHRWRALRAEVDAKIFEHYLATLRPPAPHQEMRSGSTALAFLARNVASRAAIPRQRRRGKTC